MQLGVVTDFADVPLDAVAWNAIVAQCDTNTIFQTYEWFDAWWRTFGEQHQLYFVWVKKDEKIIAFASLMVTIGAYGLRKLEFTGSGNADYLDFCYPQERPACLDAVMRFLQQRGDWDVLRLANLPTHAESFRRLTALTRACQMHFVHETTLACPTLILKDRTDQVRSMIDKYSVRRKVKWFSKQGKLQVIHVVDAHAIEAHLTRFFEQHTERWHRHNAPSQFERPGQREFFTRLTHALSANRWLIFTVVQLDDEPLAYHFGFDYGERLIWYKPSFSARYAEHSPGVVLMRSLIEEALRAGKHEFDYTVGAEAFKFRFSNAVRSNAYVSIYRGWGRYALALALDGLRELARRIVRPLRSVMCSLRQKASHKSLSEP